MGTRRRLGVGLAFTAVALWAFGSSAQITVPAPREVPAGTLDMTPVNAEVATQSGTYAPQVALEVPPGRSGQAPNINLVYSAQRANGPLGAGWGLAFESSIERRSAYGGVSDGGVTSTFWVDGEKLIAMADGTYRRRHDDFMVFTQVKDGINTIGWTVAKDGYVWGYGVTANTSTSKTTNANAVEYQDESGAKGTRVKWWLSETKDPFGNLVSYSYTVPTVIVTGTAQTSYRHLINYIKYNTYTYVYFGYEDRDDVRADYRNGQKRLEGKRLRRIYAKRYSSGYWYTSHYYLFTYTQATNDNQSLLAQVKSLELTNTKSPPTTTTEGAAAGIVLGTFTYEDSATSWGSAEALTLKGAPTVTVAGEYFSFAELTDVNADSRPDLVIFADDCVVVVPESRTGVGSDSVSNPLTGEAITVPASSYECTSGHQVYLNEQEVTKSTSYVSGTSRVFRYDSGLSTQVNSFFGPLHDQSLAAAQAFVMDLNRDGFADLVKGGGTETALGSYALGSASGWGVTVTGVSWATNWNFERYQFADLNGDGLVDMVGQSAYLLNTTTEPFMNGASGSIVDPVVDATTSAFSYWATAKASGCMTKSTSEFFMGEDLGLDGYGNYTPEPVTGTGIVPDDYVWRKTQHGDLNGDGVTDRLVNFVVPKMSSSTVTSSGLAAYIYEENVTQCGSYDQIFFGDGRGGFSQAGYGVGWSGTGYKVDQTRTFDNPTELNTVTYVYGVNSFALADWDGNGRGEVVNNCGAMTTVTSPFSWDKPAGTGVAWDRGLKTTGGLAAGFELAYNGSCPETSSPLGFFGQSLLDYHSAFTGDVNGDGMTDLVTFSNPSSQRAVSVSGSTAPWDGWADGLYWYKNARGTAQNRLTSITQPHGGEIDISWSFSAEEEENVVPVNVETVARVTGPSGRTKYEFTAGAYDDGEFLGFGMAVTDETRGAELVETYDVRQEGRGKPLTAELYDANGYLKNLRIYVSGNEEGDTCLSWGTSCVPWDTAEPYYNPLMRVCEFEHGTGNMLTVLGDDLTTYFDACMAFISGAGTTTTCPSSATLADQTVSNPLGADDYPNTERYEAGTVFTNLTYTGEQTGTIDGQVMLARKSLSGRTWEKSAQGSKTLYRKNTQDQYGAQKQTSDLDAVTNGVASGEGDYRFYVTDYEYDVAIGHITKQIDHRDIERTDDSLVRCFTYSSYSSSYAGAWLEEELTQDAFGSIYEKYDYQDFQNYQWRTKYQFSCVGSTCSAGRNLERRTFSTYGEVATRKDAADHTTTFTYDSCGEVSSTKDALGYDLQTVRDGACRTDYEQTKYGTTTVVKTEVSTDGYGRVKERATDPGNGTMTERFCYDANSTASTPSRVTIQPEPDGTTTLLKEYVDEYGRLMTSARCQASASVTSCPSTSSFETTFACTADTEVVEVTERYETTGDIALVTGPYRIADAAYPVAEWSYDEFGRKVTELQPDGTYIGYEYELGKRRGIDPMGYVIEVTFDTVEESVTVDGNLRAGTRKNAFGQVVEETYANGYAKTSSYDVYGRKTKETLPEVYVLASGGSTAAKSSPVIGYEYATDDLLTKKTDANGHATSYGYDSIHRQTRVTGPDLVVTAQTTYVDGAYPSRKVETVDDLGNKRAEYQDGLGRPWQRIATDCQVTTLTYDSRGRVSKEELPWGEVKTAVVHEAGLEKVETSTQDSVVARATTSFDARGNVESIVGADGETSARAYDLMGRLTRATLGSRETESHEYNANGWATLSLMNGAATHREYDSRGRVTKEEQGYDAAMSPAALVTTTRRYTDLDQLDAEFDGEGNVLVYNYDNLGRQTYAWAYDSLGTVEWYTYTSYDAVGNPTQKRNGVGLDARYEYDEYNRVTQVTEPGKCDVTTTYARGTRSGTQAGCASGYTEGLGEWVITTTAPDATSASCDVGMATTWSGTGETTRRYLDGEGRAYRTNAKDGTYVENDYANGLLVAQRRYGSSGALDATKYYEHYADSQRGYRNWDWMSPAEEASCTSVPSGCAIAHVTTAYTTGGRLSSVTDAAGNVTSYGYEPGTMLVTSIAYGGLMERGYAYDAGYPVVTEVRTKDRDEVLGDIVETTSLERYLRPGTVTRTYGSAEETVGFAYDDAGRKTQSTFARESDSVTVTETLNARSQLLARQYTVNGVVANPLSFAYRTNGELETVTYPSGNQVTYEYDTSGRLTKVKKTSDGRKVLELSDFDGQARAALLSFADDVTMTRGLDSYGREETRTLTGVATTARQETFGYSDIGLLETVAAVESGASVTTTYAYNARGHLLAESKSSGASYAFTYDDVTGLRRAKSRTASGRTTTETYAYDPGNRIRMIDTHAVGWDGHGRQTSDAAGRTFSFGFANQLLSVTESGAVIESNIYDANGVRAAKSVNGGVEYFCSGARTDEIFEHKDAAGSIEDYVRMPGTGTVVASLNASGNITPVVRSITGSPYRIGANSKAHIYTTANAFGEVDVESGVMASDLGFHQMLVSEGEGLLIAGVRTYDADTGRFLTPDPLRFGAAADVNDSADFFRYAHHNPIALADPTGFAAKGVQPKCVMGADGGCGVGSFFAGQGPQFSDHDPGANYDLKVYNGGMGGGGQITLAPDATEAEVSEAASRDGANIEEEGEPSPTRKDAPAKKVGGAASEKDTGAANPAAATGDPAKGDTKANERDAASETATEEGSPGKMAEAGALGGKIVKTGGTTGSNGNVENAAAKTAGIEPTSATAKAPDPREKAISTLVGQLRESFGTESVYSLKSQGQIVNAYQKALEKNMAADGTVDYGTVLETMRASLTADRETAGATTPAAEHFGQMALGTYEVGPVLAEAGSVVWNVYSVTRGQIGNLVSAINGDEPAKYVWGPLLGERLGAEATAAGWASTLPGAAVWNPAGIDPVLQLDPTKAIDLSSP